jgi:hypothetical protein
VAVIVGRGIGSVLAEGEAILDLAPIAEVEMEAARCRTGSELPDGTFLLLQPTDLMEQVASWVFRGHCRELLDRVAEGQDTRSATDAELVLALRRLSVAEPLTGVTVGLYLRLFARVFPGPVAQVPDDAVHDYQRVHGNDIDRQEAWLRRRMPCGWRLSPGRDAPAA